MGDPIDEVYRAPSATIHGTGGMRVAWCSLIAHGACVALWPTQMAALARRTATAVRPLMLAGALIAPLLLLALLR